MKSSKLLNKQFLLCILGIVLFKAILELMYVIYICPNHNNKGFIYEPTTTSITISWLAILLILPFYWKLSTQKESSAKVLALWLLIAYIPSTTIFGYLNAEGLLWESFILYWLVLLLMMYLLQRITIPAIPNHWLKHRTIILTVTALILSSVVVFVSGYYFKFQFSLNFTQVTEVRSQYKAVAMPGIFHYLLPLASTLLPILLLYFLASKRYVMSIIVLLVLLLDFSIAGHRVIFLKVMLCLIGFFAYKLFKVRYFAWYFTAGIVLSLLVYFMLDQTILSSLVRRGFYVPGILNVEYYQYFVQHPPDFYSQGIIGTISGNESQYSESIAKIIGEQYAGIGSGNNANNGLYSDAVSNFGVSLIFVQAILIAIYLKLYDWSTKSIDERYEFVPVFVVAQTLISALITTSLVTHGLIALLFVLIFFPKKEGA